jgi:hypothetical protein
MYSACRQNTGVLRMLCCRLFYLSVRYALRTGVAESVGYCPDHGVRFPVGQRYFRSAPHPGRLTILYEGCPESILPFWISRESIAWPWCNLVASQRRPYSASLNTLPWASQPAVRRRWLILCAVWPSHSQWPSEQINSIVTMRLPILRLSCRFFFPPKTSHHPGLPALLQPRFDSLRHMALRKAKFAVERKETCECDGHTVHKLSQRRLTADWLASRDSVHGCTVRSPLTGCQVTSRPRDRFSRY